MAFPTTIFSLIGVVSFLLFSQVSAKCSNFTKTGDPDTEPGDGAQILSVGTICRPTATKECRLDYAGTVNAQGYSNLSLSENDLLPLYSLVSDKFLYSFSSFENQTQQSVGSGFGTAGNSTFTVAGYFGFTPDYVCYNGTLSDCSNGPVEDGTGIRLCGPATFGPPTSLFGTVTFINTDSQTAASLGINPGLSRNAVSTLPKGVKGVVSGATGRLTDLGRGAWVACWVVFLSSLLV